MIIVHNARAQQKGLTILGCVGAEILLVLSFILGEFYHRLSDIIFILSLMIGAIVICVIIYFCVSRLYDSVFIFDEVGIVRKVNKRVVLTVKWEDVESIGAFQIYDFFKIDFGPVFIGISYYDENQKLHNLVYAFPAKEAKQLEMSQLNEKLDYFASLVR